jgi:hypothetical protein
VHGLIGRSEHVGRIDVVGRHRDIGLPPDVVAENFDLINRLVGAGVPQLGWTVGGEEQHRHAIDRSLNHGGLSISDGGAGRSNPPGGATRGSSPPQRREGIAPLVNMQHHMGVRVAGRRNREGG